LVLHAQREEIESYSEMGRIDILNRLSAVVLFILQLIDQRCLLMINLTNL